MQYDNHYEFPIFTDDINCKKSFAMEFIDNHPEFVISQFKEQPPKRKVYLLVYKYPRPGIKQATEVFLNELKQEILNSSALKVLIKD